MAIFTAWPVQSRIVKRFAKGFPGCCKADVFGNNFYAACLKPKRVIILPFRLPLVYSSVAATAKFSCFVSLRMVLVARENRTTERKPKKCQLNGDMFPTG